MAIKFNRSQTFATNDTVTSAKLHNLVDGLDVYQALITDQVALTTVSTADKLLIADADLTASDAPRSVTVQELFNDALSSGTFEALTSSGAITGGTLTGKISSTLGTITNLTAGTTTSTAATIPALTAGTTTSTAANITNGTVQTLTSSTATITGGTFGGVVNSTTGTITNLSTTLAGDLTISQGTATLGTSGVTAGTYGTSTIIPRIAVDSKGRVTSVGTSSVSAGKVLQVVSASVTGGSGGFSTTSTSYVDITGLSASITPSATSSNILFNVSIAANFDVVVGYKITRQIGSGSETDVSVGTAYGSSRRSATFAPSYYYSNTCSFSLIDSPNTSGTAVTYRVKVARGDSVGSYVFRLNLSYSSTDTDIATNFISSSHIILAEIAG